MAEQNITYQEVNEFVRRELKKHGKYLVDEFKENLTKNKNIDTGTLIGSLRYELFDPDEGGIGMRIVSAGDTIYGRLFEIAGKKRARLSKMPVNVNRIVASRNIDLGVAHSLCKRIVRPSGLVDVQTEH